MNNEIELLEKQIDEMKNISDMEQLVKVHNDISTKLHNIKCQINDAEKYVDSIQNVCDNDDIDDIFCESDTSDESYEQNSQYSNEKYIRDIEELKDIELKIKEKDLDLEELIDIYEKSQLITQDVMEYLKNQKLRIVNID